MLWFHHIYLNNDHWTLYADFLRTKRAEGQYVTVSLEIRENRRERPRKDNLSSPADATNDSHSHRNRISNPLITILRVRLRHDINRSNGQDRLSDSGCTQTSSQREALTPGGDPTADEHVSRSVPVGRKEHGQGRWPRVDGCSAKGEHPGPTRCAKLLAFRALALTTSFIKN